MVCCRNFGQYKCLVRKRNRRNAREYGIFRNRKARDIEDNLREIYGAEIPQTLISKITDKILPKVNEWQNRPLETIYPIVYFDGIMFKSRKDSQIINKCVYISTGD